MNSKYLVIGGIAIFIILMFGVGLYMLGDKDQQKETLGAQNTNQMTSDYGNQNQESNKDGGESKISNMQPDEFKKAIDSGEYTLVDIRTEEEFTSGHINGATLSDFYQTQEFNSYLDSLDKNKKYLIYCRSGNRSGQALSIMKNKGFSEASDLAGGIGAWTAAGFPVE